MLTHHKSWLSLFHLFLFSQKDNSIFNINFFPGKQKQANEGLYLFSTVFP